MLGGLDSIIPVWRYAAVGELTRRETLLGTAAVAALAVLPVAAPALPAPTHKFWLYGKTGAPRWWIGEYRGMPHTMIMQQLQRNSSIDAAIIKMGNKYIVANRDYGNPHSITWRFNVPLEQLPLVVRNA